MTPQTQGDLRRQLFAPRSIALIGASDDLSKNAARPLQFLRRGGFAGPIYPVNPRRATVLGERAWPSLDALPERPDHAFVLVPTEAAIEAVAQCGRAGIPLATVLADGFAAPGGVGAARSARLKAVCGETGIRVIGPSSLGVIDLRSRLLLTANAAFAEPDLPVGRIFAASHSGSIIGALASRGKARGVGFAGLISVGLEIDLGIGEMLATTLDDRDVDGYMLFLETVRQADALRAFARGAAERGKPVVAYKLGRSHEARELAVTHSGALAGEDDVADAFLADCGIARVDTFDALLEALPLLRRVSPRRSTARRTTVGVVTTTGGAAAMVVDRLALAGVEVVAPAPATLDRLAAAGVAAEGGRIIDLTLAGTRYDVMKAALDTLLAAPEFDLVVAVIGSSARFQPELAVRPVIECAHGAKPLAAFVAPEAPDALAQLAAAGVPSFRTPEACADAIAAALARRAPTPRVSASRPAPAQTRMLDELCAYALLDRRGVPRAPAVAIEADIAASPALPFAYPVAAKVLAADIAHKTDVGGVALGIPDGDALVAAVGEIVENVRRRRPDSKIERVLVQPMIAGIGEVLIGYRIDPEVGPLVILAMGGVLTEIYRDRVVRLAPVDLAAAHEMIATVKGIETLAGFRGRPAGDLEALAQAIVAFSQLAVADDTVVEAEINPRIVRRVGDGVLAVDALVLWRGEG